MIIYKLTNKINGVSYIGQTVGSLKQRINQHFNVAKSGSELYLHNAIRKYGIDNFKTEIISTCNNINTLNEMEIYYIKKFDTFGVNGYNLTEGGGGKVGCICSDETKRKMSLAQKKYYKTHDGYNKGKKHTKETKLKMSLAKKGKCSGENNPMYGKKFTEEHKLKLSLARKGRIFSEETKLKMSLAHKGKKASEETKRRITKNHKKPMAKNWLLIDPKGNEIYIKNLYEWCRKNKLKYQSLIHTVNNKQKYYKGWRCERLSE